ncbi:hypothetical protein [Roseicyclus sp.]|uniref:hypothetical protein n=1 Tax=Roseicyclus sp. TaxID=1914329 RepID=UPI001BCC9913|nr:hypothetical protein [Roseicyclus sp.]
MFRIGLVCALFLVLGGCVANMQLGTALTSRGVIDQANLQLGQVMLWNRQEGTTRPIGRIDPARFGVASSSLREQETATFTGSAKLIGGVDLPDRLRGELESEVANRSQIALRNMRFTNLDGPRSAFYETVRAEPAFWYAELGLERNGNLRLPEGVFLVIVSQVTTGQSLRVNVDRELDAGGTFTSSVITARGPVRFRISDARSLEIQSSEGDTNLFAQFQIFATARGENGIRLLPVDDRAARGELAAAIASGR